MGKIFLAGLLLFLSGCGLHFGDLSPKNADKHLQSKLKHFVQKWKHTPYVLGGASRRGSDCSAFTQAILAEFGAKIPRTTRAQLNGGEKILKKDLKAGDLVFFRTGRGPNGLHVGIYLGNGAFAHLSTRGGSKEARLDNPYWKPKFIGSRRYKLQGTR